MFNEIKKIVQSLYNRYFKKEDNNNFRDTPLEIQEEKTSKIFPDLSDEEIDYLFAQLAAEDAIIKAAEEEALKQADNSVDDDIEDYEPDYYDESPKDKYWNEIRDLSYRIKKDPLLPYFRGFSRSDLEGSFIYQYKKEGRPFTPEDYGNIFKKYISKDSFLAEHKLSYLSKIWEDAKYIERLLEPLKSMRIKYSLDLTGGSVRDYVLDNHEKIKDLDFMVSVQDEYVSYYNLDKYFSKDQIEQVKINSNDSLETKKVKLVQLCLLKNKEEITLYNHIKDIRDGDEDDPYSEITSTRPSEKGRIMAVYKINQNSTHYPIDIILTDYSKPLFIDDFDFDICKASMCFISPYVEKEFPLEPSHLISRFIATNGFWADVHNKVLTYNCTVRNTYHINSAFNKHLPRIKAKYPDYEVLIIGDSEHRPLIEANILTLELNESLVEKIEVKPTKKLKL